MRLLFALASFVLSTQAAIAFDASALTVIGFSPDGRAFALAEDGDNEGGHYTTTIVMDVAKSRNVAGSPFVGIEDNETLEKANARAASTIRRLKIATKPSRPGLAASLPRRMPGFSCPNWRWASCPALAAAFR